MSHFLSFNAPLYLLIAVIYSPQQALKVFFGFDGLSLTSESDCRLRLTLFFTSLWKEEEKKVLNGMWKKKTWSSKSLTSYLARWSTASMTLVPSLALVSQNKAPYACKQSINIPDSTLFIETPGGTGRLYKQFDITQNERYTPWPTSLRANCSHSFPRDAALGGRPYFQ